jgi:hypothetical protein
MPAPLKLAPVALRVAARLLSRPAGDGSGRVAAPTDGRGLLAAWLLHLGLAFCFVASAALLLGALAVRTDVRWLLWAQAAVGLAMIAEGALLATDWRGARRLTLWRLQRRRPPAKDITVGGRIASGLASLALQALGVGFVAAGTLTALLGLQRLF